MAIFSLYCRVAQFDEWILTTPDICLYADIEVDLPSYPEKGFYFKQDCWKDIEKAIFEKKIKITESSNSTLFLQFLDKKKEDYDIDIDFELLSVNGISPDWVVYP